MSTTELGETIVLKEIEINTYIRRKDSLRRISSERVSVKRLKEGPRRSRLMDFRRLKDTFLHHLKWAMELRKN